MNLSGGKTVKYSITDEKSQETGEMTVKPLWRRINILDIIFVIAVILIALAAASFFTPFSFFGLGGEKKIVSYTVEIDNVDATMAEMLKVGDKVFDSGGKNEIGSVTAIKSTDTVRYVYSAAAGALEAVSYPPDVNGNVPKTLRVTIQVTADYSSGSGYTASGNRISVGTPMTLCFVGFTGIGNCISVYVIGNASGVSS